MPERIKLWQSGIKHFINEKSEIVKEVVGNVVVENWNSDNPFGVLMDARSSKQDRFSAALSLVSKLLPKAVLNSVASSYSVRLDYVPLNGEYFNTDERLKFRGKSTNTVFFLESQDKRYPSYALKLNHELQITDPKELVQIASEQKNEYEEIVNYCKSVPNLVIPEEHYFLMQGLNKKVAICTLSEFQDPPIRDIFYLNKSGILQLLNNNRLLSLTLRRFVGLFDEFSNFHTKQLDLIGKNNWQLLVNLGKKDCAF